MPGIDGDHGARAAAQKTGRLKEGLKKGISGTVETLREFGHGDLEIKNAIMQRYELTAEEAEEYLCEEM